VLSNYLGKRHSSPRHEIIDRDEPERGVRKIDAIEHQPAGPYGLIASISTVEHVGWDDVPRDTTKAFRAIELMRSWLRQAVSSSSRSFSGYHPTPDRSLVDGTQLFDRPWFLCGELTQRPLG
jgi:hypothetical protein